MSEKGKTLHDLLKNSPDAAVAVSGGVDSMTLAHAAHRSMGKRVSMFHALSPAVPKAATLRVKVHAKRENWRLHILDAGEFSDENYLKNPANRCFYCKTNLYGALSAASDGQLFSGTNIDDLGDWRPGLKAADNHRVRHPFVEAGLTKSDVRALSDDLGLEDLVDLPASPCLSSRVETGLRIDGDVLRLIDEAENLLRDEIAPKTVRCRLRADGIVVELDDDSLRALDDDQQKLLSNKILSSFKHTPQTRLFFTTYRMGSAFLREVGDG